MIESIGIILIILIICMIVMIKNYMNMINSCTLDNPYVTELSDSILRIFQLIIVFGFCLGALLLKGN